MSTSINFPLITEQTQFKISLRFPTYTTMITSKTPNPDMITSFYNQAFPKLDVGSDYLLREQTSEDAAGFLSYYTDPEVVKHILATQPTNIAEALSDIQYCRNLFHQKRGIYWSLVRKADNQILGAVGIYINNQHHRAEICYDLAKPYWQQGIMTAALKQVLQFTIRYIGAYRLEALTLKENIPSIKVLEKLGFEHEGTLRNYRYFRGASHDVELYGATPEMVTQTIAKLQVVAEAA